MTFLTLNLYGSQIAHHDIFTQNDSYLWENDLLSPFDELIISWDSQRPQTGYYHIQVSVFVKEWSPWLDYAFWGAHDQYTFDQSCPQAYCKTFQDTIDIVEGEKATGFKIRVIAFEGASLQQFRTLHACMTDLTEHKISHEVLNERTYINLDVNGLSQAALPDERCMRLCSPTSTTAVINYLSPCLGVSPLPFADTIWDSTFDIYGNWILNTAQASHLLGHTWSCYVARLTSFDEILMSLEQGYPVVVSIKGPISGGADPYESGHLIVIKGYDAIKHKVLCMDPAFSEDALTHVGYDLNDFLTAWGRRNGIAYLFMGAVPAICPKGPALVYL